MHIILNYVQVNQLGTFQEAMNIYTNKDRSLFDCVHVSGNLKRLLSTEQQELAGR